MTEYLDTWVRDRQYVEPPAQRSIGLASISRSLQGLIGTLDPVKLARGVDISHWQGVVDIALMVKDGGISFCFPKCSDGKQVVSGDPVNPKNYVDDRLYENVQKCYDAGIPCMPYHYVQPFINADTTVKGTADWNMQCLHAALDRLVPKVSYHAIVLDVEEKTMTEPNCSDVVMAMIKAIDADPKFSQVPLIIYTSISVLNWYNGLREQTSQQGHSREFWMAQWSYNTVTNTTWQNMIENIMPKINMKVLTPGYANWRFLQWSSSFILPGCSGRMDQNVFNGTKEALFSWLKFTPANTTPPDEPPPDDDPNTPPADDTELAKRVTALEGEVTALKDTVSKIAAWGKGFPTA